MILGTFLYRKSPILPSINRQSLGVQGMKTAKKTSKNSLFIKFFGSPQLLSSTKAPIALPTTKSMALLLYLAWETKCLEGPVPKEKMIDLLWPGMPATSALQNLRQTIYQLRKSLAGESMGDIIESDRKTLWLNDPDRIRSDLDLYFSSAANSGSVPNLEMEQMVRVNHGVFLDNFHVPGSENFEEWVEKSRASLRTYYISNLEKLVKHKLSNREGKAANRYAVQLVEAEPLSEMNQSLLLKTYDLLGDRNKALLAFHTYEQLLEKELGVKPGAEISHLAREVGPKKGKIQIVSSVKRPILLFWGILILFLVGLIGLGIISTGKLDEAKSPLRMAILPFENNTSRAYLADGLTDDIITALSKLEGMQMISRQSSVQYKGSNLSPAEIGNQLDVTYLLKGSLQEEDGIFRVHLQCFETENGEVKWAEVITRSYAEIFSFQAAIADEVAKKLKMTFNLNGKPSTIAKEQSKAYETYLRGRYAFYEAKPEALKEAEQHFINALKLDPEFRQAHAWLAWTYCSMAGSWGDKRAEDMYPKVMRELSIIKDDPTLKASYHRTLGWTHFWLLDLEESEKQLRLAVEYDPNIEFGLSGLAMILTLGRKFEEAQLIAQQALDINPHFFWNYFGIAQAFYYDRKFEKAMPLIEEAISLNDRHQASIGIKAGIYFQTGDITKSLEFLQQELIKFPDRPPGFLADLSIAYHVSGDSVNSRKLLNELLRRNENGEKFTAYFAAKAYSALGKSDSAVVMLKKAYAEKDNELNWVRADFEFQDTYFVNRLSFLEK